jgi:hypothetical protein
VLDRRQKRRRAGVVHGGAKLREEEIPRPQRLLGKAARAAGVSLDSEWKKMTPRFPFSVPLSQETAEPIFSRLYYEMNTENNKRSAKIALSLVGGSKGKESRSRGDE